MKHPIAFAFLMLCLLTAARAESTDSVSVTAQPVVDSEARKSHDGFTGAILATTDENWKEKWEAPGDEKLDFTLATSVPPGKQVAVLIFFVNPKLDGEGNANVRCDLKMTAPDGTVTLDKKDSACFKGKYEGGPNDLALAPGAINFTGDPDDAPGFWTVEVMLRDAVRNTELPLKTGFTLAKPQPAAAKKKKKAKNQESSE